MRAPLTAALAVLVALLSLTGCGGGTTDAEPTAVRTAANGEVFNDADVAFASEMIPHHAQALVMVDLTLGRELDPAVQRLAEDVRTAQTPEIEQMTDWLTAWDEPVPETSRDHANAHGGGMDDHAEMPGMMSEDEMSALEAARGEEFQRRWLEMMVEHHRGAVEMARAEQEAGVFDPAIELAEEIETAQQQEIEAMTELLES